MASTAVGFVLNKLSELGINELKKQLGLDDEIMFIKMTLEWLSEYLVEADQKRRQTQHGEMRVCVKQIREVAYDIEDVLDEYAIKLDSQRKGSSGWRDSLHSLISPNIQFFTRRDLASKIRKIKKRLEVIASNKAMFPSRNINPFLSSQDSSSTEMRIRTLRIEVEEEPTGQDAYVELLKPKILDTKAQGVAIIPIFGMGGLGKTTLAKRLYNEREVVSHFKLRAWLTISQKFSGIDLLGSLMDQLSLKEGNTKEMKEDEMKRRLKDYLINKSFILVLDDLWKISSWEYLQAIFPKEHAGITVLLTTRKKNIAIDASPKPFELQPLAPEHSWVLFCKKAFNDDNCPVEFVQFREEVIKRCKGLPLSTILLAGILRKRKETYQWRKILDQKITNSEMEDNELLHSIVALSYDDLPPRLKPCFLYVSVYPEDYKIDAQELMRMWIAEGFIQQRQEGLTMEDLAEDHLEELLQRSLIQLIERDKLGQVSSIRIHDAVLDMARNEGREINFLHQNMPQESSVPTRHLSLCDDEIIHRYFNSLQRYPTSKLRALHLHHIGSKTEFPSKYFNFHPLQFLRVLRIIKINFPNGLCPDAIGHMIQLRYLQFSFTNLVKIPYNISNLQNLQTLDIEESPFTRLPQKFWEIASLRHVIGHANFEINPPDATMLTKLQTLIGEKVNYEWIIKDGLLKFSNIRRLCINGVSTAGRSQNRKRLEEKLVDAINDLEHLTYLSLGRELASTKILTSSNACLQYLKLVGRIEIENGALKQDYRQHMLPNLHSLELDSMMNLTEDVMEVIGLLPKLEFLAIRWGYHLTHLVFKKGYFSSLQKLALYGCERLVSWQVNRDWSNSTPTLQFVQIERCPGLTLLPRGLQVKEIELGYYHVSNETELWAAVTRAQQQQIIPEWFFN